MPMTQNLSPSTMNYLRKLAALEAEMKRRGMPIPDRTPPAKAIQTRLSEADQDALTLSPADWIENNFYLYDTGQLMTLFDCQRRPLELALSRDEQGRFRFNTVLWSWPKKSAKSSVIAAVADYTASTRIRGSIKLVAND